MAIVRMTMTMATYLIPIHSLSIMLSSQTHPQSMKIDVHALSFHLFLYTSCYSKLKVKIYEIQKAQQSEVL